MFWLIRHEAMVQTSSQRIGWSIGFNSWTNWTLYGVIPRSLCKISSQWCLRNVQLLKTTVNWCWWRFTHTFCLGSNILLCTHCFRLFMLWFNDEDASFVWSWRCFSSFKSLYAIFAHILQYYHDFQSNVAAFPSIVQVYAKPYSFGGRIKLIKCQIRHDLSVTINEISTGWKKTLDGGPNI